MRAKYEHISLRVPPEQKDALDRIANERGAPVVVILRDAIAALTGVPNTHARYARRIDRVGGKAVT